MKNENDALSKLKKTNIINLYLDDSGTRHPSKKQGKQAAHGYDWFALGGILVGDHDEEQARNVHAEFVERWKISNPLHSSEIRSQNENFLWLRGMSDEEKNNFYEDLYCTMREAPVTGIACVIDRPGYNLRYAEKYTQNPWMLCKTAFSVVVERAAKYAISRGCRLRVLPEKCNKTEDGAIAAYYRELRTEGLPFDPANSGKYAPLAVDQFAATLYDLKFKAKSSPMMQLADLYLWPICIGGYHSGNRPYRRLMDDGKLIECAIDPADHSILGSKYSCFEAVTRKE